MTDVDVVIVNYKSAAHTLKCISAVREVARQESMVVEVFVINNGDDSMSLEGDARDAGATRVMTNGENLGFGAASNMGASLGKAPLIYFLNPDAVVGANSLKPLASFLRDPKNSEFAIVGPEIRDAPGSVVPSCSRRPSLLNLISRTIGLHRLNVGAGYPYLSLEDHAKSREVGQVMGAALMIRRVVFEEVNGFDERLFLYYEDVDLSARVSDRGFRSYYLKSAWVTHVGRASSSQNTGLSLALHIRSRITYAGLHFGLLGKTALLMACALFELPIRLLRAMLGKGEVSLSGVFRAYSLLALNLFTGTALPQPGRGIQREH